MRKLFPSLTEPCQRWRNGRDSYRPAGEVIQTSSYEVASIADDTTAKAFVLAHHYSGRYPAARFRYGLYRGAELVGVAVFSQPMNNLVITGTFDGLSHTDGVELGRFVLLDEVPGNGESWFIARTFELLRAEGVAGVVSYSDPTQRTNAHGEAVFGGHLGTIYQATNGIYLGRGTRRTLNLLPDGNVFSDRAASKIRKQERGWAYAVEQLVSHGAAPPSDSEDLAAWLKRELGQICRKLRHPGNHKYAWGLQRGVRKRLVRAAPGLAYPKSLDRS